MTAIASRPGQVVAQIGERLVEAGVGVHGARILIVGVAYKPGLRDVRASPGVAILLELLNRGAQVDYFDPYIPSLALKSPEVLLSVGEPDAASYDLVLVNTLHPNIDYAWLKSARLVVDPSARYQPTARPRPVAEIDSDQEAVPRILLVAADLQRKPAEQLRYVVAEASAALTIDP